MPAARLFVTEKNAAGLLDLPVRDFRDLVRRGALPRPVKIGGVYDRWSTKQLEAIHTGAAMDDEEPEW
jgi:predicted DNA-binding transcriptional regulator AlpA